MSARCECGAALVKIGGMDWCANTLAKYRALYGEPQHKPEPPRYIGQEDLFTAKEAPCHE